MLQKITIKFEIMAIQFMQNILSVQFKARDKIILLLIRQGWALIAQSTSAAKNVLSKHGNIDLMKFMTDDNKQSQKVTCEIGHLKMAKKSNYDLNF